MADLSIYRKDPVHCRAITMTTYKIDDETVMVEGHLKDDRFVDTFSMSKGSMITPGIIHEMKIRLLIKGVDMIIEDVDVELCTMPREECLEVSETLKPLVGQKIAPGFSGYIKKTFGGKKGCAHQNSLVIAMASAVVQGIWTNRASKYLDKKEYSKIMKPEMIINTCNVWRDDGPLAERLRQEIDKQ